MIRELGLFERSARFFDRQLSLADLAARRLGWLDHFSNFNGPDIGPDTWWAPSLVRV